MRFSTRLFALGVAVQAILSFAHADDVAPASENRLYPIVPTPGSGFPTAGQFSGFAPVSSSAPATSSVTRPASGALRLQVSLVGASFAGAVPEFAIGDIVGTPLTNFTDAQNRNIPLRREPVRKTEAAFKFRLLNSSTTGDFTPGTTILSERFFWSQHARFTTVPDISGGYERQTVTGETGTARDGFVYANQGGSSRIYWRTEAPIAVDGNQQPIYGLVDRAVVVSTASRLPVRRIFWTEQGFQGQAVLVPKGDIQQVRVAYTDALPELVPAGQEFVPPGRVDTSGPLPRFTLSYDGLQGALRAYNREGRVMIEFLGEIRSTAGSLRRQIGVEIVDIIQEAAPVLVEVPLGERLYPLPPENQTAQVYPLSADAGQRNTALNFVETELATYTPSMVMVLGTSFTGQFQVAGQTAYYAEKVTNSASDVQIFWQETGIANLKWPRFLNRYHQYWPDDLADYSLNIRPTDLTLGPDTLPIFGDLGNFQLIYQDDITGTQAGLSQNSGFQVILDNSDPVNRSLILFQTTDGRFWYQRVESVLDSYLNSPAANDRYNGQYSQNSDLASATYDFNSGLNGASLRGSAVLANGSVRLTDNIGGQVGTVTFPNPAAGDANPASGFTVDFSLTLGPTTSGPADGMSFAVGNLGSGAWGVTGPGTSHSIAVGFDTYANGGNGAVGAHLWVNGVHVDYNPINPYTGGASVPVQITFDEERGISVTFNGRTLFSHVAAPGFTLQNSDSFGFGGNTGGFYEICTVDNVKIAVRTMLAALVGERIAPPAGAASIAGYVDLTKGDAIDPSAYLDPFKSGIIAAEKGAIIPVNAAPRGAKKNELGVWWFKKVSPPANLAGRISPTYWPSYYTRYRLKWPVNAEQIVLASNKGSGDLDPDAAAGVIYFRNDPAAVGYNPNEEHAQMITGRAYALRDDLNNPQTTSDNYVLVRYTSASDLRPAIKAFRVLRENETYTFRYDAKAGTVLQAPLPLAIMPLPLLQNQTSRNAEVTPANLDPAVAPPGGGLGEIDYYNRFTFEDRKGLKWIYRGQHNPNNSPPALGMKFYYPTQVGFAYPNLTTGVNEAPAVGTLTPFLWDGTNGDRKTGTSITISYTPYWPDRMPQVADRDEVPTLQFAETLIEPKNGLPGLRGASSAKILYQQSIGQNVINSQKSAVLHDPTRRKITLLAPSELSGLPSSIATSISSGRTYFQRLPAHLQSRFYLDPALGTGNPTLGGLVLEGQFKDEIVGEDYLLPNILSADDLTAIKGLVSNSDTRATAWRAAVDRLSTTLQTFIENPAVPGTYIPDPARNRVVAQDQLVELTSDDQAVDSYALTGVGGGRGYVTLLLGNGRAFTNSSEPVQLQILKVGPTDLYRGQVKPITASNPLAEDLTLQHTGDFGGRVQDFEFQWFYTPPVDGQPPQNLPGEPGTAWFANPGSGPRIAIGGTQPLLTLTDNYFVMRYRPKIGHVLRPNSNTWDDTQGWSQWTAPALAEGWIKRVLAGINPYNQRLGDFFNNTVNTDVSLLTQAGTRWEGDVPLTARSAQDAGLIEIYETVLRRGINFTIDGTPAFDYGPANDALLLASGYLNDLYLALGNEAYADASNPTISLDAGGSAIQSTATARFAFEGQVASLLDEELSLLRGRDDFLVPGVQIAPVYNRFFWNYTRGINAGEVIYALNYNITEKAGATADGKIDATDAARQYPQGHGDAYGHYLTALTNYYRLLSDANFTWTPRVEAVNILGVPVTVDYQDERKLALAAVSAGRAVSRVIDLERRKLPVGTNAGWSALRETKLNSTTNKTRAWGAEQWASRGGQGNFIHWAVTNALLPENDVAHEGIQKIDRHSVPELNELVSLGAEIQSHLDGANRRVNALNLSENSILFDLSPAQLTSGTTHFDQVLVRAKAALANASTAYDRTSAQNALLRTVENQSNDYAYTVAQQETAFNNTLIDFYGRPYSGDIGPGKTYPDGYTGPDYLRFMYIDRPYIYNASQLFGTAPRNNTYILPIKQSSFKKAILAFDGSTFEAEHLNEIFLGSQKSTDPTINVTYVFNLNDGPYQIAPASMGRRTLTGKVQDSLLAVMNAREQLAHRLNALADPPIGIVPSATESFRLSLQRFSDDIEAKLTIRGANSGYNAAKLLANKLLGAYQLSIDIQEKAVKTYEEIAASVVMGFPQVNGLANDVTSAARAAVLASKVAANKPIDAQVVTQKVATYLTTLGLDLAELGKNETTAELQYQIDTRAAIFDLKDKYRDLFASVRDLDEANQDLVGALNDYQDVLTLALRAQTERETFRKRAASVIQGARTRDVAFRAFRTESLEQYKTLYNQAARYTYLAAKAYDYETTLLGTDSGRNFLAGIVSTRSLGLVGGGGEPQFGGGSSGDPGLSSYLAKLQADWNVAKGRLGINNPDQYGTLFSLRRELFNLPYDENNPSKTDGDDAWQDRLRASIVADLRTDPAVAAHALPTSNPTGLAQPGFIITFSGAIESGENFFGNPLGAGDNSFSSASYSTKINSVGVAFKGYLGTSATGTTDPNGLSATPYVYLIPAGNDYLRTPPLNGAPVVVREWLVHDHAMPLPYDIGSGGFGQNTTWTSSTVLSEPFFLPRMHQPFRAVSDTSILSGRIPDDFTNRRLVGRSVWNNKWKLVIPAQTLLADPQDGMERFIRSVRDIKLFLRTYSNAGN